jgi:predicted nucleic acid-binding Zn ribbon protein
VNANLQPHDDGSHEPDTAARAPSTCPLCGVAVAPGDERCPACNTSLSGVGGRPGPFSRRVLWLWAAALLAIYLVALAVVALVPA